MQRSTLGILVLVSIVVAWSFADQNTGWERPEIPEVKGNPLTDESIQLGGALFGELLFSQDTSISCQSCHINVDAFADHLPVGEGIKGRTVTRNTPTLFNVGFHPSFMIDGKFASLEDQVMGPIMDHREFNMDPEELMKRLKTVPFYDELSEKAYGQPLTLEIVQKAIANFERVLISDDSRFDRFMKGEAELSAEEMRGYALFSSDELQCSGCHGGYFFSSFEFENNGLYEQYGDSGRALITGLDRDIAKFKVPTLRNIALTYPYMHNGSMETLDEVIDHYASGGADHIHKSERIHGFDISEDDKDALIAFLNALTEVRLEEMN